MVRAYNYCATLHSIAGYVGIGAEFNMKLKKTRL